MLYYVKAYRYKTAKSVLKSSFYSKLKVSGLKKLQKRLIPELALETSFKDNVVSGVNNLDGNKEFTIKYTKNKTLIKVTGKISRKSLKKKGRFNIGSERIYLHRLTTDSLKNFAENGAGKTISEEELNQQLAFFLFSHNRVEEARTIFEKLGKDKVYQQNFEMLQQ